MPSFSTFSGFTAVVLCVAATGCAMNAGNELAPAPEAATQPSSSPMVVNAHAAPRLGALPEVPGSPEPVAPPLHENGEGCGADWECRSGFCSDFACAPAPAAPLHADGEGCADDTECASGYCLEFLCSEPRQ